MKRLTTSIFIVLLIATASQAQEIELPNYILGGSFTFNKANDDYELTTPNSTMVYAMDNSRFNFSINPYIAKQINKSDMIGLELQYVRSVNTSGLDTIVVSEETSNGFGIGIFYRKYFYTVQSFSFFLQPSVKFLHTIGKIEQSTPALEENKSNNYQAAVSINVSYTINKWSLFANLIGVNYNHIRSRSASEDSINRRTSFGLNTALTNFRFGIERRF